MKHVKILAIDDNADNLVVLNALLSEAFPGMSYLRSLSGKDGIKCCISENPDVVLLDILMPEMDGYEVCALLKSDEKTKSIPIIMITAARTDKESRIKALECGADAFLAKPVDESELTAQVRAMIRIKESEDRKLNEKERLKKLVEKRTIALQNELKERQRAEERLKAALAKAQESDRLKTAFLSNMSHEIRTPLNSIIGFSELMQDPDADPEQHRQFAKMINANGSHLLSIISDIMDLSKIEAGQVQVKKEIISINQLIADLRKEYSFKAVVKGIEFIVDQSGLKEEIRIESDDSKIKQIMDCLIGNAIKFTKEGFVEIGLRKTYDSVQFHVKDTGIGIPKEFHQLIFERFRQVEAVDTRRYGGNGLGLAISKSLAELLGGKIWMESEEGKGSIFYFKVPLSTEEISRTMPIFSKEQDT